MLLSDADVVIPVPNDVLFTSLDADISAEKAFLKADESMASAVRGIAEIMRCDNFLATDFADFKELLGGKKSVCHIGLGIAEGDKGNSDRCSAAAESLLDSPLLGGEKNLKSADAMFISVIGGDDFSLGEMKQTLEIIRHKTGDETRIVTGVNTDKAYSGTIYVTVVAMEYDKSVVVDRKPSSKLTEPRSLNVVRSVSEFRKTPSELVQGELAFQTTSRGYFSKTTPNIVNGEDIDVPPFQRHGITLDKGE
jgi:cell division GTPase FtsZ